MIFQQKKMKKNTQDTSLVKKKKNLELFTTNPKSMKKKKYADFL